MKNWDSELEKFRDDPLGLLTILGGCYIRPPGGPLVGYAGTYNDGVKDLNFVGELYANFAKAERYPQVMNSWAQRLWTTHQSTLRNVHTFLGAPEAGKSLADKLALHASCQFCYPDVRETPTDSGRPKKDFVWGRHELEPGSEVVITEDVGNNFSTTEKLMDLIIRADCTPIALVCLLNRSPTVEHEFTCTHGTIPVLSLVRMPMPEYRQDDPKVANDIASGNIVWKPRASPQAWQQLMDAMEKAS